MGFDESFDRKSGIGASESYAAKEQCIELWQTKRGEKEEFTGNLATELGQKSEAINLEIACREADITLLSINEETRRHPKYPGIFATADAFGTATINGREEKVIIEAKLTGFRRSAHWEIPHQKKVYAPDVPATTDWDSIPEYVQTQVIQQMAVYDVWYAYVSCWMGTDLKVYGPLLRDLDREHEQIRQTLVFLDMIKNSEEPPVDHTPAWKKYLSKKYKQTKKLTKKGNVQTSKRIHRRVEIAEMIADLTKEKEAIDNRLRAEIGKLEAVETDVGTATWKTNRLGNRVLKIKRRKE